MVISRPGIPVQVRRGFWLRVREGSSVDAAADAVGVSRVTGWRLFARCGGVIPDLTSAVGPVVHHRQLSLDERHQIAALRHAGLRPAEIARMLGRHRSTIGRELARNVNGEGKYLPAAANARAELRSRERGQRASPRRLARCPRLAQEVAARLAAGHSPQQISHRLRLDFPEDDVMRVSHETIYQSIYVQGRGELRRDLASHLRTGRSLRKPRRQHQAYRQAQSQRGKQRIKDMVMISERPPEVADRAVPGHWEGDLIVGSLSKSAIGTLVERHSGFVQLLHLPDNHGAVAVQEQIINAVHALPATLWKTLTWDQGIEMATHPQITAATGVEVYFCDPHSPWQRATSENTNGLARQYFPKHTDLSVHSKEDLDRVAALLNNRPRRRLNWATPAEVLARYCPGQQTISVAFTP